MLFLTNKTFNANACMYNVLSAAASGRVNRFVYIGRAAGPQRACGRFLPPSCCPRPWSKPAGRDFLFCFCYLSIKWSWHNFFFCLSPAGGRRMLHHFVITFTASRLLLAATACAGLRICTRSWPARSMRACRARPTRT